MSPKLINKMIEREQKILKRKEKKEFSPKNIYVTESDRSKRFGSILRQKLVDCLFKPSYMSKLNNKILHFPKIKIPINFSHVVVTWSLPTNECSLKDVFDLQKVLDSISSDVRNDIEQIALMGKIPPIIFVRDLTVEVEENFSKLMSEIQKLNDQAADESLSFHDVELKNDVLGVKREEAIAQVMAKVELAKAPHRNPVHQYFEHTQDRKSDANHVKLDT